MASNVLPGALATRSKSPIGQRFQRTSDGWFVNQNSEVHGPYPDKAAAQTALMYYSVKAAWPTEKELRQFFHIGR